MSRTTTRIRSKVRLTQKQEIMLATYYGRGGQNIEKTATLLDCTRANVWAMMQTKNVKARMLELAQAATHSGGESIARLQEILEYWTAVMRDTDESTRARIYAGEVIAKCRGEFAAEKADVAVNVAIALTNEQDDALLEYMMFRTDPRMIALLGDLRQERGLTG